MRSLAGLVSVIALFASATMASAQALPTTDKDKPAAAPQQQATPATPSAPPAAKPTTLTRLAIGAKAPACSTVAAPTTADPAYKKVTVTRPATGIPVGTGIGVNVPGKLGLDRVDADRQLVTMVQECDGGQTYALRAVLTNVTDKVEEFTILVPDTAKPFELRSCSPKANGACAYGAFKGDVSLPIVLGSFLGGKVASK